MNVKLMIARLAVRVETMNALILGDEKLILTPQMEAGEQGALDVNIDEALL